MAHLATREAPDYMLSIVLRVRVAGLRLLEWDRGGFECSGRLTHWMQRMRGYPLPDKLQNVTLYVYELIVAGRVDP